jgi:hypothetical protein
MIFCRVTPKHHQMIMVSSAHCGPLGDHDTCSSRRVTRTHSRPTVGNLIVSTRGVARTEPVRLPGRGTARDLPPVPGHLSPRVGLHPVHPGAAELQVVAEPAVGSGAPADTVAGLQHDHVQPHAAQLARGNEPREPGADDDDADVGAGLAAVRTAGLPSTDMRLTSVIIVVSTHAAYRADWRRSHRRPHARCLQGPPRTARSR